MACRFMKQNGDTIIEVMFATVIAGLVIVIAISVMNRGLATTQMAVEHTMVRQGIDGQAEALRYLRDNKGASGGINTSAAWNEITRNSRLKASATPFGPTSCTVNPVNDFFIDVNQTNINNMIQTPDSDPTTGAEVFATPGHGMWIEAVGSSTSDYVDFHIRACWDPPFSGPKATLGTIVRLTK